MSDFNFKIEDYLGGNDAEKGEVETVQVDPIEVAPAEEKEKKKRKPKAITRTRVKVDKEYAAEYKTYMESCQARKAEINKANAALKEALRAKQEAMQEWSSYISQLRLRVAEAKAQPKLLPPRKGDMAAEANAIGEEGS